MREIYRVSGAGIVDVVTLLIRQKPIVVRVIDSLETQGRAQLVALGGVIVDDVQDHFDAVRVKLVDHFLEFVRERRVQIARLRREEAQGVVAPVVSQALLDEIAVVDERMHRQQLGRRHAERAQVSRHVLMSQGGECPALLLGDARIELGEALDVHLVHDRPFPGHDRARRPPPGKGGIDHPALLHQARTVALVERFILVGMTQGVTEQLRPPFERTNQLLGIGVEQQLVGIEAMPGIRLVGAVNAESVDGARTRR
jgi:hypothetical protein